MFVTCKCTSRAPVSDQPDQPDLSDLSAKSDYIKISRRGAVSNRKFTKIHIIIKKIIFFHVAFGKN